ncbi:MAG: lysophospholipid acyltransferase family protein [Spirochaetes bacterium]|nr:lysophospholipid acyltransferase family protein [Spirochaetota bacterium]
MMMWKSLKTGFFSFLISFLMRIVYLTSRKIYLGKDILDKTASKGPVIFVIWHGKFFPFIKFGSKYYRHTRILTSLSDDGELLSKIIRNFGADVIRGDERRGGVKGLIDMIKIYKKGWNILFAADGPLGPYQKLKPGVISCASKTGGPIMPVSCSASRAFIFKKAWDKFFFAKPFSKLVVKFGEPVYLPGKMTEKEIIEASIKIEKTINNLTHDCDKVAGHEKGLIG